MRISLLFVAIAILFASCGGSGNQTDANQTDEPTQEAMTLGAFLEKAADLVDKEVQVKGAVDHVCVHSGMRLTLVCEDTEESIKVNAPSEAGKFETTWNGKKVLVTGVAKEDRLYEKDLAEWETELNAEKARVDSIKAAEEAQVTEETSEEVVEDTTAVEAEETHEQAEGEAHRDCSTGLAQIDEMRTWMKDNGKDYFPIYHIDCKTIEELK
ncbi:MAG: hypothetical protein C0594_02685 [Marinilabiliales bacterium]|nr:MAG: hypothetical protein C0594_02685 [Marinilabiliales bacterium]